MSAKTEALRCVADAISEYADCIYVDAYGDQNRSQHDSSIKEHFEGLAGYLQDKATELEQ